MNTVLEVPVSMKPVGFLLTKVTSVPTGGFWVKVRLLGVSSADASPLLLTVINMVKLVPVEATLVTATRLAVSAAAACTATLWVAKFELMAPPLMPSVPVALKLKNRVPRADAL